MAFSIGQAHWEIEVRGKPESAVMRISLLCGRGAIVFADENDLRTLKMRIQDTARTSRCAFN